MWISSCPARASARVSGRRVKRRSAVRKHQARESEDRWVLVTSGRLQRSHEGHLAAERPCFRVRNVCRC